MWEFWQAVMDPRVGFLRTALLMGLVSSIAFGVTGTFVVVKRISYVAGAIAHAVLGGIGASLYAQGVWGWTWLHPLLGALLAALLAAMIIAWVRNRGMEREDSVIGAVWATGMAVGLIFIAKTPGFVDPMSYLFGNILILSPTDLYWVLALDGVLLVTLVLFYPKLQAIAFDEELAQLRGVRVPLFYTLLLALVACTVVLLISVVGVVLVVALLTIPAAMSSTHCRSLLSVMVLSSLLTCVFISIGIFASFLSDWPTGPTIILAAATCYFLHAAVLHLPLPWRRC